MAEVAFFFFGKAVSAPRPERELTQKFGFFGLVLTSWRGVFGLVNQKQRRNAKWLESASELITYFLSIDCA